MSLPDLFDERGRMLLALVAGLANFLTVLTVMRALSPPDLVTARARRHARRRRELRAARLAPKRAGLRQPIHVARQLVERLKLDRSKEAKTAADLMAQAGWRFQDATTVFLAARLIAPFVLGIAAYLLAPALFPQLEGMQRLVAAAGATLLGAYAPNLVLKNAILRRQAALLKGLPDALDLMVICAEAGLSLDAALTRVSREIGASAPELADELGLTVIELGFLPNRKDALVNLARRAPLPAMRGLTHTLVQAERYGTPLAQALRVLAAEFRDNRMMKAEEKAARLPATLTVPMITFILPPLFVVLIGPAIIQALAANWG